MVNFEFCALSKCKILTRYNVPVIGFHLLVYDCICRFFPILFDFLSGL